MVHFSLLLNTFWNKIQWYLGINEISISHKFPEKNTFRKQQNLELDVKKCIFSYSELFGAHRLLTKARDNKTWIFFHRWLRGSFSIRFSKLHSSTVCLSVPLSHWKLLYVWQLFSTGLLLFRILKWTRQNLLAHLHIIFCLTVCSEKIIYERIHEIALHFSSNVCLTYDFSVCKQSYGLLCLIPVRRAGYSTDNWYAKKCFTE